MEHINRQTVFFSVNLLGALSALCCEISLMAWFAGLSDGTAAEVCGKALMTALLGISAMTVLWPMPVRPRRQLLMSATELWSLTAAAALTLLLGFMTVCADC